MSFVGPVVLCNPLLVGNFEICVCAIWDVFAEELVALSTRHGQLPVGYAMRDTEQMVVGGRCDI